MMTAIGGLGIFLVGMLLLTDGIRSVSGRTLKLILLRFVRGPLTAIASGAGLTAVVQSSSATTLTTIGFVSAGLITFRQAIGVIFGANIGTTSTGWIVSMLGFKVSMVVIAMPLILAGALLRLFGRGRVTHIGMAVAGFGLLFVGIDMLAAGMAGLSARIDPASMPGSGLGGRLVLVGVGVLMTVLMQSSSAAMAVTLAAVHTGGIDIAQGASLVIGQNIGTTATALIASAGGSTPARRTAAAHIFFNLITGAVAFVLLPAFEWAVSAWYGDRSERPGIGWLAAFHTGFNVLGVMMLLPLMGPFARLIERLVPERGSEFTRHLEPAVVHMGSVAIEAARRSLMEVFGAMVDSAVAVLRQERLSAKNFDRVRDARAALPRIGDFIADVTSASSDPRIGNEQVELVHAMDHLIEFGETLDRLDDEPSLLRADRPSTMIASAAELLGAISSLEQAEIARRAASIAEQRKRLRQELLASTARHQIPADEASAQIDAVRRIDALCYHAVRAALHLEASRTA